jgi:hypothetical protein
MTLQAVFDGNVLTFEQVSAEDWLTSFSGRAAKLAEAQETFECFLNSVRYARTSAPERLLVWLDRVHSDHKYASALTRANKWSTFGVEEMLTGALFEDARKNAIFILRIKGLL